MMQQFPFNLLPSRNTSETALYVIGVDMQMGSRFKKTVISENVRRSLHGWHRRAKTKQHGSSTPLLNEMSVASLDSLGDDDDAEIISDGPVEAPDVESMSSLAQEDTSIAPGEIDASLEEGHDLQLDDDGSLNRAHSYPLFDGDCSNQDRDHDEL